MNEIFLSASVPIVGRGNFHETADPFLIQCAVRELVISVIRTHTIVWGGHPAITPMIWTICEDLNVKYSESVVLYQSRFYEDRFPEENERFKNVVLIDAVPDDKDGSLDEMRKAMLSRPALTTAVFIGGMEGIGAEFDIFSKLHPEGKVLLVPSPGGAALQLAERLGFDAATLRDVDFASLFYRELGQSIVSPPKPKPPR